MNTNTTKTVYLNDAEVYSVIESSIRGKLDLRRSEWEAKFEPQEVSREIGGGTIFDCKRVQVFSGVKVSFTRKGPNEQK